MKAAIFYTKDDVHIEELPKPDIGHGEILVQTTAVGLCGSDIDKITAEAVPPGTVLGHEVVGKVIEAGDGVDGFKLGERVVVAHHVSCQACHYCNRGSHSKCALFKSTKLEPGGFAEFIRVPAPIVESATFSIPDHIADEQAVFTEPLACCVRAVEKSQIRPGDVILIVGAGVIGLLFVQLAKLKGARVLVTDLLSDRLQLSQDLGADFGLNPITDPIQDIVLEATEERGVDTIISTVASQSVLDQAIALVRDGGMINFFAGLRGGLEVTLDLNELYEREVGVITSYSSSPQALEEAFHLIVEGKVSVERLISHPMPLSNVLRGVQLMVQNEALKVYFYH